MNDVSVSAPVHDFSPDTLRSFLRARVHHDVCQNGGTNVGAWKRMGAALRKATGLKSHQVQAAYMGRLVGSRARAAVWGALGVNPADGAVMLHDDGSQAPAAKWGSVDDG